MSLEDVSYEARDELARLAKQLSDNPETRSPFLKLAKKVRPDVSMPEIEIEEKYTQRFQDFEAKLAARDAKQAERDAMDNLDYRRKSLLEKGLVSSKDEIQEVEKVMLDKGITNHEVAAEYHKYMKQAAVPTPSGYNPNPMKKFDLSAFHKNPIQAARETAAQALSEFRKPVRPIGL
jgi:hypothetical protein